MHRCTDSGIHRRFALARMTSAGLIYENGREFLFQPVRKRPMVATRAGHAAEDAARDGPALQDREPGLDLVHPAASDGREMEVEARIVCQPGANDRVIVGPIVVNYERGERRYLTTGAADATVRRKVGRHSLGGDRSAHAV